MGNWIYEKGDWNETTVREVRSFINVDGDEVMHILTTGFNDTYIVTFEDAYEQKLGHTEVMSSQQIKGKYAIEL